MKIDIIAIRVEFSAAVVNDAQASNDMAACLREAFGATFDLSMTRKHAAGYGVTPL